MNLRHLGAAAFVIVAMLAMPLGGHTAEAQQTFVTPADIEAQIAPAVSLIRTPFATGSGALVGPRRVLTNAHVVEPYDVVSVTFLNGQRFDNAPILSLYPQGFPPRTALSVNCTS